MSPLRPNTSPPAKTLSKLHARALRECSISCAMVTAKGKQPKSELLRKAKAFPQPRVPRLDFFLFSWSHLKMIHFNISLAHQNLVTSSWGSSHCKGTSGSKGLITEADPLCDLHSVVTQAKHLPLCLFSLLGGAGLVSASA